MGNSGYGESLEYLFTDGEQGLAELWKLLLIKKFHIVLGDRKKGRVLVSVFYCCEETL